MKVKLLAILLLFSTGLSAQTYWAKKQAGSNVDETLAVTGDNSGNTYTTGYYSGSASINGQAKVVNGLTDIFVTKLNSSGTSSWVISAGGSASDRGLGIDVDGQGNVLVSGFFTNSVNFGNGVTITANSGSQDAFVAKFSSTGTIIWAKSGGSSGNSDRANSVAVDNAGNVFVTGQFAGEASFGPFSITSQANSIDAFIIKYDSNGTEQWLKKGSGSAIDRGLSITTDSQGNAYAVGQFSGNISFDNTYTNTILNAFFTIKYSASGNEEWFRYAGGSEQSIANSVSSDGNNIYVTGDFGSSLTFFGAGNFTLNSGYTNAVFIASYSASGSLLWTKSQGSTSRVSARSISVNNGEIGVAGWHECTFESLSAEYGESTFNSIGYKDVFVMRYTTSGGFTFARNFGSDTDEIATGIHLLPDGKEVITGVYRGKLIIPVGATSVDGLLPLYESPNPGLTYCNDPNYGNFGYFFSQSGYDEDGFTIKAIDPNRSPFDMYKRFGSGCDLSIPDACIDILQDPNSYSCPESVINCPSYSVYAHNFIPLNSEIGYNSNYNWTPSGNSAYYGVIEEGSVSVTITSEDGCYTSSASVDVEFHPEAEPPLLSDNVVVNTLAENPLPILLCYGEEVDLWCQYESGYTFYWTGPGITNSGQTNNDTVTVSASGTYTFHAVNEFDCSYPVSVQINYIETPPLDLDPFLKFNSDTLVICGNANGGVQAWDLITDQIVPYEPYDFDWNISSPGTISGSSSSANMSFPENGWYVVDLEIVTEENICWDEQLVYNLTDSVYVIKHPAPSVDFTLTGPSYICPEDTITLYSDYTEGATPTYNFTIIEDFGDSLYVFGAGSYSAFVILTNELGCSGSSAESLYISEAPTPSISVVPDITAVCPGDSVLLLLDTPGDNIWQGPSGIIGSGAEIFVNEAGLYFTEVTLYPGCALVSNTIQLSEYATPYLAGNGGVLCEGDTVEISIVSTSITNISWQAPFSGSDTSQFVTSPGIYSVQVTSCNTVSEIFIEVNLDTNSVSIIQPDLTPVCAGDSILIQAIPNTYPIYNWSNQASGTEIYITSQGSVSLQAIDEYGCTLFSNSINLNFDLLPPLPVFQYSPVCDGEEQLVTIINSGFDITYLDQPYGEIVQTTSILSIPEFYGDTTLFAYLSTEFCKGPIDSLSLSSKPYPAIPIIASDAPVCTGKTLEFIVLNSQDDVTYNWLSPTGETFNGSDVNYNTSGIEDEGYYYCYADLNACHSATDSTHVSLFETRMVTLPADTSMCYQANFLVMANDTFSTYLWHTGSTDSTFIPEIGSSEISLITTDENGCKSSDAMLISIIDCSINVPNVFTPNGDGFNDSWIAFTEEPLFFHIEVYNRWGRVVYETRSALNTWDGNNYKSGEQCSEGVYFYILKINNFEGMAVEQTGNITLIRD